MDHETMLRAFFDAENRRDWETYRTYLHPDVKWVLHKEGGEPREIVGLTAYVEAMERAYEGSNATFVCDALVKGQSGDRFVTILRNSEGALSCDIFDFQDGLIALEHEFLLG